jgi:hypothetical protein
MACNTTSPPIYLASPFRFAKGRPAANQVNIQQTKQFNAFEEKQLNASYTDGY